MADAERLQEFLEGGVGVFFTRVRSFSGSRVRQVLELVLGSNLSFWTAVKHW
jgi:hypothetical protein